MSLGPASDWCVTTANTCDVLDFCSVGSMALISVEWLCWPRAPRMTVDLLCSWSSRATVGNAFNRSRLVCAHGRYVIVPLIKPDSSPELLFAVACMVTGASLFSMGAIKVRLVEYIYSLLKDIVAEVCIYILLRVLGTAICLLGFYPGRVTYAVCVHFHATFVSDSPLQLQLLHDFKLISTHARQCSVACQSQFGTRQWHISGLDRKSVV